MPENYLRDKGWTYRKVGRELIVRDCPFCQDQKNHFYLNIETGVFDCKKCGEKGNLNSLKKSQGDSKAGGLRSLGSEKKYQPPDTNLAEKYYKGISERALAYWQSRGISSETIDRFLLGSVSQNKKEYITIPHFREGKLINIKKRSIPPAEKDFRRMPGSETILFNVDCLQDFDEVILCEGEMDTLTLLQEGFENVVGLTAGAMSFPPQFYECLKGKKKVFICMDEGDKDNEGQKGAEEIARRLGRAKCKNVEIPPGAHDVNGLKEKVSNDFRVLFDGLLVEATDFRIPNILTFENIIESMTEEEEAIEPFTPWANVNRLLGTVKDGHVVVISALPKTGKSSFAENIIHYQTMKADQVGLYYCLEMPYKEIVHRFCTIHFSKSVITQEERKSLCESLGENRFIVGFNETELTSQIVFETIREAVGRYGIRVVVFDHIHFLFRGNEIDQQVGTFMRDAKLLATELGLKLILIAQPKKVDNPDKMLDSQDLKYGGSIYSDCDILILLKRKRVKVKDEREESDSALSDLAKVRVEGSRYSSGGETFLDFHGATMRFETTQSDYLPLEDQ